MKSLQVFDCLLTKTIKKLDNTTTSVGLLISTYNWADALYLCLQSVLNQTILPSEILIADDGSNDKTREIVDEFSKKTTIPVIHIWHEDNGFQLAKIRNRAIKKATTSYIIQVDGDLILNQYFISDHLKFAKKNHFIRGSRVRLGQKLSAELLQQKKIKFSFFNADIQNRFNGLRCYFVAKLLSKPSSNPHKMLGCNMSYWRSDALLANGYENLLVGWGHEDEEFAARMVNIGLKKIKLKHFGFVNHIYHPERVRNNEATHNAFLKTVILEKKQRALNGINQLE